MRSLSQNIDHRQADFTSTISARLDHLQAVCAQLANCTSVQAHVRVSPAHVQHQQQSTDRSSNVVVFGVTDDRVANVWRQTLDAAVSFVMLWMLSMLIDLVVLMPLKLDQLFLNDGQSAIDVLLYQIVTN